MSGSCCPRAVEFKYFSVVTQFFGLKRHKRFQWFSFHFSNTRDLVRGCCLMDTWLAARQFLLSLHSQPPPPPPSASLHLSFLCWCGGEEETTTIKKKIQETARSGKHGAHKQGEQMFPRCGLRLQEGPWSWLGYTLAALFTYSSPKALFLS